MANQLAMDKSLAFNNLRDAGYSERRIAKTLGVSRGAVRRHLAAESSNSTTAPTAANDQAPTGSADSNSTTEPTGSDQPQETDDVAASNSQCEPFRDIVIEKCEAGLSARRIHQDLVADHGSSVSYWSLNRFVKALGANTALPFRRMEVQPGEELQVDFGTGAKIRGADGTYRRTHVFRAVLSHSRKGYSEAVFRQDTERFIRALENCFWALGGVPQRVVFDNAKCAVKKPDWHDPELNPKLESTISPTISPTKCVCEMPGTQRLDYNNRVGRSFCEIACVGNSLFRQEPSGKHSDRKAGRHAAPSHCS